MNLHNIIKVVRAISPVATPIDNTAQVSQIVDRAGYEGLEFAIATGAVPDVDATFAVTMQHGDQANLSDAAAVSADDLIGTLAAAGFTFADDDSTRKIGYKGTKRYVRLTITPANNTSATLLAAVAILSGARKAPVA